MTIHSVIQSSKRTEQKQAILLHELLRTHTRNTIQGPTLDRAELCTGQFDETYRRPGISV